jgi:hypothetical protein
VSRTLAVAAALFLIGLARPAIAEPTDAEKDAARILFTEGKELRDAGKVTAALERFQRAYDLAATPITTVELARTHVMLGHLVEARRLVRSLETSEKKPGESAKSVAARDDAKRLATELDAKIPTIIVRADGATTATLDGKPITLGAAIAIDPGKHSLVVDKKTEELTVKEGERDRVITIEPIKAAPPPVVPPKKIEPEPKNTTLLWIGGVAGGVGLLVGAGAGALALSNASTVKDGCPSNLCPPSRHEDLDATRRWATISTIGFAVGAVGATLFVIGIASAPSTKKDSLSASLVPYASPAGGGLGLSGSF